MAGARASKDPEIYEATYKALKAAYHLSLVDAGMSRGGPPKTVDEAVERLVTELNLKDKARIARMRQAPCRSAWGTIFEGHSA